MSRVLTISLVALSLFLLGGAWLVSRALTSDVTAPPSQLPQRPPLVTVVPPPTQPAPAAAAPSPAPRPEVAVAPEAALQPAAAVASPPDVPTPTQGSPDSDFRDPHAPQLEEAWRLTNGPDANVATWRNARQLFERCLAQVPDNVSCQQGLAVVNHLIASSPEPDVRDFRRGGPRSRMRRVAREEPE